MKPYILIPLLTLTGCAQVQQAIGANPQAAAGIAIAVEARVGVQCVERAKAGVTDVSQRQLRLHYERIGVDMALASMLSQSALEGIHRARDLTDSICPPLGVIAGEPGN